MNSEHGWNIAGVLFIAFIIVVGVTALRDESTIGDALATQAGLQRIMEAGR